MKKVIALAGLVTIAACGGGSKTPAAAPATEGSTQQQTQGRQGFPGATGLLAALSGSTLQVQSETAQTAVTYSATTTFSDTVAAALSDIKVGSCVTVRSAADPAAATPAATPPTSLTAVSVSVLEAVDGSCTGGAGRFRGGNGTPPSGAPNGGFQGGGGGGGGTRPSGAPRTGVRFGGFGGGAVGKVTSVSGAGFVVASTRPSFNGSTAAPTTTDVTVAVTPTTTYTAAKKATAAALKVGECVTARGASDSTGTIAATTISLRPATNGSCTTTAGGPLG